MRQPQVDPIFLFVFQLRQPQVHPNFPFLFHLRQPQVDLIFSFFFDLRLRLKSRLATVPLQAGFLALAAVASRKNMKNK